MMLGEEKIVPVTEITVDDPHTQVEQNKVTVIRIPSERNVELAYRWIEGGFDRILSIVVNSPTIGVGDVSAALTIWAEDKDRL